LFSELAFEGVTQHTRGVSKWFSTVITSAFVYYRTSFTLMITWKEDLHKKYN